MQVSVQDQARYDATLEQAARAFSRKTGKDLISIKLRPLTENEKFPQDYVYFDEYQELEALLARHGAVASKHNGMVKYSFGGADEFVFVHHETGPEIIAILDIFQHGGVAVASVAAGLGAAAVAGSKIIKFINDASDLIRGNKSKHAQQKTKTRAINVEKRVLKAAKVIRQVGKAAKKGSKAIEKVQDLLT